MIDLSIGIMAAVRKIDSKGVAVGTEGVGFKLQSSCWLCHPQISQDRFHLLAACVTGCGDMIVMSIGAFMDTEFYNECSFVIYIRIGTAFPHRQKKV